MDIDTWLKEAKQDKSADKIGMYLVHNGVVRQSATGLLFSYNKEKVDAAIAEMYQMDGIYYNRVWLNEGQLTVGDDIMYVLVGGDIRPHVVDALQALVSKIKSECVEETELYG